MVLVLTRKTSEKVVLLVPGYEPIEIVIVDTSTGRTRIGIEADRRIGVHRSEIYAAIKRKAS